MRVVGVRQRDRDHASRPRLHSSSTAARTAAAIAAGPCPAEVFARARRSRRPASSRAQACAVARHRAVERGGVVRIVAGDHLQQAAASSSAVRPNGPDLIERRGERDHAVARDAAVGRLDADDAAERRRLADRAAGVGAERAGAQRRRRRPRPSRPTSRPARASRSHGLRTGPYARVLVRRAHGELVHVELAERGPRPPLAGARDGVPSYGGTQPSRILRRAVVSRPSVTKSP